MHPWGTGFGADGSLLIVPMENPTPEAANAKAQPLADGCQGCGRRGGLGISAPRRALNACGAQQRGCLNWTAPHQQKGQDLERLLQHPGLGPQHLQYEVHMEAEHQEVRAAGGAHPRAAVEVQLHFVRRAAAGPERHASAPARHAAGGVEARGVALDVVAVHVAVTVVVVDVPRLWGRAALRVLGRVGGGLLEVPEVVVLEEPGQGGPLERGEGRAISNTTTDALPNPGSRAGAGPSCA